MSQTHHFDYLLNQTTFNTLSMLKNALNMFEINALPIAITAPHEIKN